MAAASRAKPVAYQATAMRKAPSETAASSSSLPCDCISGISSRAMNGKVMNSVAMIMPGTAKTMPAGAQISDSELEVLAAPLAAAEGEEVIGETVE